MVVPVLVRVLVFSPRFLCVLYKKESNENIIIIPFRRLPLRVDLTREKNTPLKRPDESQHHPQSRRRKKNDQSPIRPRALRTMPGDKKHSRVRQQRHDRPVTEIRTDTRPGGNNRQKSLQGTETLFTKSASARDAGKVLGEPSETERLEENGESESTEKETFENGGSTRTTDTGGRVRATSTTPTTTRSVGKNRRRKNDDGEEDKEY